MFYRLTDKEKTLTQIDPVYSNVTAYMTVRDKIDYCKRLISEIENFLDASANLLDERTIRKYNAIILAAQTEIREQLTVQENDE